MFQKGIDNVYLLSGGLKDMSEKYPEYVIGRLPIKPGTASKKGLSMSFVSLTQQILLPDLLAVLAAHLQNLAQRHLQLEKLPLHLHHQ